MTSPRQLHDSLVFESWLASLPRWLQTAAADLIANNRPCTEIEVKALADLAFAEVTQPPVPYRTVPVGHFTSDPAGPTIRIRGIESPVGINALSPGAKLDFGAAGLVVVYGQNGSGKSGYARLLKCATGAKAASPPLGNVFAPAPTSQSVTIRIEREGADVSSLAWDPSSGPVKALLHAHVFDTEAARAYVASKSTAAYEPRRLRFISALVDVGAAVKAELVARKAQFPQVRPAIPPELAATVLGKFLTSPPPTTSASALQERCARTPKHEEYKQSLERALREPDPARRLTDAKLLDEALHKLENGVAALAEQVSDAAFARILEARLDAVTKRKIADESVAATSAQTVLPGVGQQTWRAMWDAARKFSLEVAYPNCAFPHTSSEARCPLCQQPLAPDAQTRLHGFEAFVRGTLAQEAKDAEIRSSGLIAALPQLPSLDDWRARYATAEANGETVDAAYHSVRDRLLAVKTFEAVANLPELELVTLLATLWAKRMSMIDEMAKLGELVAGGKRPALEAELRELRMLDWANDNMIALLAELTRVRALDALERAERLTSPAKLTIKKNELAPVELEQGYQDRFRAELKALGAGWLKVGPVSDPAVKGVIKFDLRLSSTTTDATPSAVLSEGEARIVALAAFLADVTVAGARTPFIFDDPISSLDQTFEEKVAERLVALAAERQVIVFTHRLSLATLLADAIKAQKQRTGHSPTASIHLRLSRFGSEVGLVGGVSPQEDAIEKVLNNVHDHRLVAARKAVEAGELETGDALIKAICSDFRTLVERSVETILLDNVVVRFRRSIKTGSGFARLSRIRVEDCAVLDDLMTRYSRFEHSQSQELPLAPPVIEEVRADVARLRDWVREFQNLPVPTMTA